MKSVFCVLIGLSLGITTTFGQTGNGALSGAHYNLNIIGKKTAPTEELKNTSRHTMFVLLNGGDSATTLNRTLASSISKVNKIYLTSGEFSVLDGNAADRDGGKFQLPVGDYYVFARALGKPGGISTMTTCATGAGVDGILGTADDEIVCSTENVVLSREKGKSTFSNVTTELTSLMLDTDGDDVADTRVGLFDPMLQDYFWNYDNKGLRIAQLRFYQTN